MKIFKSMSQKESLNWRDSAMLGFYTYMMITAINYFSYSFTEKNLIPANLFFLSGIVVAFVCDTFLNLKDKSKSSYKSLSS